MTIAKYEIFVTVWPLLASSRQGFRAPGADLPNNSPFVSPHLIHTNTQELVRVCLNTSIAWKADWVTFKTTPCLSAGVANNRSRFCAPRTRDFGPKEPGAPVRFDFYSD